MEDKKSTIEVNTVIKVAVVILLSGFAVAIFIYGKKRLHNIQIPQGEIKMQEVETWI